MSKNLRNQFDQRFRGLGLNISREELDRMYEREMEFQMHLQWISEQALANQKGGVTSSPGVGGALEESDSSPFTDCIEFVVDTSDYDEFDIDITVSSNITYTVDWGDGVTENGSLSLGSNYITHAYSVHGAGVDYTVNFCFSDPGSVTELDFIGND